CDYICQRVFTQSGPEGDVQLLTSFVPPNLQQPYRIELHELAGGNAIDRCPRRGDLKRRG
ncbi:MAG: hypothetical protein ACE5HM_00600, partial [Acidiferrobacterales bacterium]